MQKILNKIYIGLTNQGVSFSQMNNELWMFIDIMNQKAIYHLKWQAKQTSMNCLKVFGTTLTCRTFILIIYTLEKRVEIIYLKN